MKLSISNIIWPKGKENLEEFFSIVSGRGLVGVELAPSCIWEEPAVLSKLEIGWLQDLLLSYELQVSALHSVTYTREDLEIFASKEKRLELIDYIESYIKLARELNCKSIVFGSPKSRKTYGRSKSECDAIFCEFLDGIDKVSDGVYINIEPLHKDSCDYINYFEDAISLIHGNNYRNIKVQLDVRSLIENEESADIIQKYSGDIVHCQVSDPGLAVPGKTHEIMHTTVKDKLKAINYKGYIAGEIINAGKLEKISYLNSAIDRLRDLYA